MNLKLCDEARDTLEFNKYIRQQLLDFYKEVPMLIPPESALLKQTDAGEFLLLVYEFYNFSFQQFTLIIR